MSARQEHERRSPRSDGTQPIDRVQIAYAPADSHGHFPPQINEDARLADIADAFDLDELELDPSERRPGGPVADEVRKNAAALPRKWAIPLAGFLIACFLQSIALYSATFSYVSWMDQLEKNLGPEADTSGVLRNVANFTSGHALIDAFKLQDSFHDCFRNLLDSSPVLILSYLTLLLPVLWAAVVFKRSNLRLWTRTLLVGTILASLKAFIAWMTVLPDPAGWGDCKAKLDEGLLQAAREGTSFLWMFKAFFDVVWLWFTNLLFGNHSSPSFVCSDGVVSGSTYMNSLFALALYDAMRVATRKMKPHFRWIYRLLVAFALTVLVLQSAHVDLMSGRQYAADVTLGIVFTLLLYSNPTIAICVDRWLTSGSNDEGPQGDEGRLQLKDPYDEGDILVPLCCFPFCCMHGRYYLYTATAEEVEKQLQHQEMQEKRLAAEARQRVAARADEFRVTQEEGARRLLELETLMESEQQRSKAREREEQEQSQKKYEKALAEVKVASELRLTQILAELEEEVRAEQQEAATHTHEGNSVGEKHQTCQLDADFDENLRSLTANLEGISSAAAEKQSELVRLQEQAVQEKTALEELELIQTDDTKEIESLSAE